MTELLFKDYVVPSADLGKNSCLPDIHVNSYIRAKISISNNISKEDGKYIGQGMIDTLLPYCITDGYDRKRTDRAFKAAILENEYIKAVFLPELGGRLWSLYDKTEERELLYKNDVFQPANLALRNAWFSGGVEWNVGIKGHNPLTCSPLFAQRAENKNGEPVLRMYEFERIRGVVYIIEATLREKDLMVKITIENTSDEDTYMYWWSNIAVPETPETRVIVPANDTFFCAYEDGGYFLDKTAMPYVGGKDITYSKNSPRSRDFFFDIPDGEKKWIATADKDGKGLLQMSDPILKGRKMFVWGQHEGGRHWNEWLSDKAGAYIEIQAGLLKTQLEHFVMKAKSTISWQESYSALSIDAQSAHGDFRNSASTVSSIVSGKEASLCPDAFDIASLGEYGLYGSGWGALENIIRKAPVSDICAFPEDSMDAEQAQWLELLKNGSLGAHEPSDEIESYVTGEFWFDKLSAKESLDWYECNQLGVISYALGKYDLAKQYFIKSAELCENPWSYRNLAQIEKNIEGNTLEAAEHMLAAITLKKDYLPLAIECAYALMAAGKYAEFVELYGALPEAVRENGRIKMLLGASYSKLGDLENAMAIITPKIKVDDIKEGEYSLSAIWTEIYGQVLAKRDGVALGELSAEQILKEYPLPYELDYRMH